MFSKNLIQRKPQDKKVNSLLRVFSDYVGYPTPRKTLLEIGSMDRTFKCFTECGRKLIITEGKAFSSWGNCS